MAENDNQKEGKFELDTAKGARDFPPEQKIARDKIVEKLKKIFELYGFNPLETPVFERLDVLTAKYAAGTESDAAKEIFKLEDQGKRKLGLRFDLTVPFARFIGMNSKMKMPFKRYQIEKVYRDGPIKLGRYRELYQCDVDVVGSKSMLVEAELMSLAVKVFEDLGLDTVIKLNNRKILDAVMEFAGIPEEKRASAILIIDKFEKISKQEVEKEFAELGIDECSVAKLLGVINSTGSNEEILSNLKQFLKSQNGAEGLKEVEEILSYTNAMGLKNIMFTPSLARGLGYYTGPIFEGFLREGEFKSSLCGGGRYDKLIGLYLNQNREYPACGISFGLEPIMEMLKQKEKEPIVNVSRVYIIPIQTYNECLKIAKELRDNNIKTDMDISMKGISKNLDYANAYKIPFVLFVGQDEINSGKYKLKDMKSGEEQLLTISEVIEQLHHKKHFEIVS